MLDSGHDSQPAHYGLKEQYRELLLFCRRMLQPSLKLCDLIAVLAGVRWQGHACKRVLTAS